MHMPQRRILPPLPKTLKHIECFMQLTHSIHTKLPRGGRTELCTPNVTVFGDKAFKGVTEVK